MIKKNKNKFRINTKSKILVLGLILFILIGLFGSVIKAQAQSPDPNALGTCTYNDGSGNRTATETKVACDARNPQGNWVANSGQEVMGTCADGSGATSSTTQANCPVPPNASWVAGAITPEESSLLQQMIKKSCGVFPISEGCALQLSYWIFHDIPAFFLLLIAYLFNFLISVSLNSDLFKDDFVGKAWTVVRDLSNLFFILILLYIAIKMILDLGKGEAKKMIVHVIIVALLINFSMFFTKVIIDSSNILALVFYNKLDVCKKTNPTDKCRPYDSVRGEKDVAGGMVSSFDPTSKLTPAFYEKIKGLDDSSPPFGIILSIVILSGIVMSVAIYALFVSGFSFLGRLIELWVLIIFSPFAFMSSTISILNDVEYLGWKSWFARLLKVAFMAPIFMFFLYFIFLLIGSNLFTGFSQTNVVGTGLVAIMTKLLSIVLPMLLICILLLKATEFAKKGSGKIGEVLTKAAGVIGGVAAGVGLGALTGGAAMLARGTVGRAASNLAESNKFRDWAAKTKGGQFISNRVSGIAGRSFDLREAPGAGALAKMGGVNLGAAKSVGLGPKKGFAENRAASVKRREEFANKLLDTSEYGKAELTRGGMTVQRAAEIEGRLIGGGMTPAQAAIHRAELMSSGISSEKTAGVARYLDAERREVYSDRLEKRKLQSLLGVYQGTAQSRSPTKRMSANKIRKSATTAAQQAQIRQLAAAFAAGTTTPPPAAGAGGAAPGGAPASCWVAEVLYGINDQKTHSARFWAATNNNWFTKLYRTHGESWAKWLVVNKWAQPIVRPIWDIMALRGQTLAVKVRNNKSLINSKFNYLLEKVK